MPWIELRHMVGRRVTAHGATSVTAVQGSGWKPSRFFGEWKESVAEIKGELVMQYMHYCEGMPADVRQEAIDHILRCTIPDACVSNDRREAFDAIDNDGDAMQEYATRFLDEFWDDYWRPLLAKRPVSTGSPPRPPSA